MPSDAGRRTTSIHQQLDQGLWIGIGMIYSSAAEAAGDTLPHRLAVKRQGDLDLALGR